MDRVALLPVRFPRSIRSGRHRTHRTFALLKFAFDDNSGLPGDFAHRLGCEFVSYHELHDMLAAFANGSVDAMFTPRGALPYLRAPYEVIAQATFCPTRGHVMSSLFRIPSNAPG